jgi:hypothetical protein
MYAAPIIGGMGVFSFRKAAVTACWVGRRISFIAAFFVKVIAAAPQTPGRLFTVCPDVAELLAVVALDKSILDYIRLHPNSNNVEARQTKMFLRLCCPRQSYEKQGQVHDFGFLGR